MKIINFKFLSINLFFVFGLFMFTSCEKVNIDSTNNQEEEVITEIVACDSIYLDIWQNAAGIFETTINSNGTAPFTYLWSTGETTPSIVPTEPGTLSVTVTDALDCVVEDETWVCLIDGTIEELPLGSGYLSLNHSGGTAPYTYLWSTGDTTQDVTVTEDGFYTVTMEDAMGCYKYASITLPYDSCQWFSVHIGEQPFGSKNLVTTVTGGTDPNTYIWSTGETTPNIIAPANGTFSVTVTDSDGCVTDEYINI